MRAIRNYLFIAIAIIGFTFVSTNAQSFASSKPARSVDEQVYHKLRGLIHYNVFDNIEWQVNGNIVTLTGKVHSLGTKSEAARSVKDIEGVTEVINNIQDLPPSPMDDRIRRAALISFTNGGPAQYFGEPNPDVRIIVENGRMALEGYVSRQSDSNLLNVLANGINGVFQVTNNLKVGERRF